MEEPTQQPNDNSTRQADSIGSEELDAAILAAVQRATDAHSAESPADASDEQSFADDDFALAGDIVEDFDDDFALLGRIVYPSDDENQDLSLQAPISPPIEEVKLPQPHADDAVLGGQNPALVGGVVLGGIEGVNSRLASAVVEQKIAALTEALKYGKAGLDLVIQALKNESKPVAQAAYFLLQDSLEPMAQQALQQHNPYRFLECTFSGHLRWVAITSIAISPDGQTLVGGSNDGTIKLWNLHTGKRLNTLKGRSGEIWSVAISPDGLTLVSGSDDGTFTLWNVHTGKELCALKGHSDFVSSVAISPDGLTLVTSSNDGTIKLWNLYTGKELRTLKGHASGVSSVAISPDGLTLVSGGRGIKFWQDRSIKLWNLHTGEQRSTFKGHSDFVSAVAIAPDGFTLVSSSNDGTIKLWNLNTGKQLRILKGHSSGVSSVAISPDGLTLVSGSNDGSIKLWNLSTGVQLHTLKGHSRQVTSVAISPDGLTLVSGSWDGVGAGDDGSIKVWRW